jgi:Mg-chelatase subunit ChlD
MNSERSCRRGVAAIVVKLVVVILCLFSSVSSEDDTSIVVNSCSERADVVFVVDSSYSVRETCPLDADGRAVDNWSLILDFLSQVVSRMPIHNTTRVGFVTFSTQVNTVVELGQFNDSAAVSDNITSLLPFSGGNTNMTGALRHVRQSMFASRDINTQQIIVLLTDGVNNVDGDPIQESRLVKQQGIQLIVVGVSDYIDELQLREMSSSPSNYSYLYASDFRHLNLLVGETLNRLVCSDPPSTLPCRDAIADIVIVLDASGSIIHPEENVTDYTNWNLMKDFVRTLILDLQVSQSDTHVALIRFSGDVDLIFPLNKYYTSATAAAACDDVDNIGSSTNTSAAIRLMRQVLTTVGVDGSRDGVNKVGIVITDGQSGNRILTKQEAAAAKAEGIQMFAIGITDNTDANELKSIASEPWDSHYYKQANFTLVSTVASQLIWSVCHSACDGSGNQSASCRSYCSPSQNASWEAHPGYLLVGLSYATLSHVDSVATCQTRCLQDYLCRSVQYVESLQQCSVSYFARSTAPAGGYRADSSVDYYELVCLSADHY